MALVVLLAVATSAEGTSCFSDSECDDGVFCNGVERCVRGRRAREILGFFIYTVPGRCRASKRGACVATGGGPARCAEDTHECLPPECPDADGDSHQAESCGGDDCDDGDATRHAGRDEVCDAAHDEDCNPTTFGNQDLDEDGFADAACCNAVAGGEPACGSDCDDSRKGIHPIATEVCDGADNDCDGEVDEGVNTALYPDADADGFGAAGSTPVPGCAPLPGYSHLANDCDDTKPAVHPGAIVCGAQGSIQICRSDGTFEPGGCPAAPCYEQPNGTGICPPP
jgi:hypothetical protein